MIDDSPQLMRGQYDICLLTYEKFAVLVLTSPHILDAVGTVVVDEVQMMADRSRGTNLEFLLTLLRMRGQDGIGPQLVALSAVIGETNGFERWLGARLLRRTERPVPLDEGVLRGDGSYRYVDSSGQEIILDNLMQREWRKDSSQDWVIPLVRKLVGEGKQVIVFRETRGETRGCALYLARELNLPPARAVIDALPTGDPSDSSSALREALAGGVAFHNSNLDRDERLLVEEHFRKPGTSLRVIAATTTLAMGVNTPAEAVVIVGLEHPGPEPYSVAEYKNMVGRAGRLGFSDRGVSYLLAVTPQEEHYTWNRYVRGVPEDIESRFLSRDTDPRSLIVRVLAATQQVSVQGLTSDEIVGFLEGSFGAYQERQRAAHWKWDQHQLRDALDDLEAHRLVIREDGLHYRLTELGRLAGEGGVQVESITRLVEALGSADASEINDPTLITAGQLTVELDDVLFPLNKKSTQKEPQTWRQELHRQGVAPSVMRALNRNVRDQHGPTLRAKKAAACLLSVTDLPMAEIERALTRFGGAPDGAAGPVRAVATRTCDLLPTVVRVAELLHAELNLEERARRLLIRLEVGVSAAAVDLASHIGTRFTRGDYRALLNIGHGSIAVVEVASDEILLSCLGGDREKLAEVRRAVRLHREQEREANAGPVLPVYEG
jgi:replicative superfamily II helicase